MAKKTKPGSWQDDKREAERILAGAKQVKFPKIPSPEEAYRDAVPQFYERLIEQYQLFQQEFGVPGSVLYPSCEMDASPVKAFPSSKVLLVDKEPAVVKALRRGGIEAVCADITKFKPKELFDLLILLNPCAETSDVSHCVKDKGFILANNYHGNASQMISNPRYLPIGTIVGEKPKMRIIRSIKPEHLDSRDWAFRDLFYIFQKVI